MQRKTVINGMRCRCTVGDGKKRTALTHSDNTFALYGDMAIWPMRVVMGKKKEDVKLKKIGVLGFMTIRLGCKSK